MSKSYLDDFTWTGNADPIFEMPLPELIAMLMPLANTHPNRHHHPYSICCDLYTHLLNDLNENLDDLLHNGNHNDAPEIIDLYTNRIKTIIAYMATLDD